MTYDKYRKKCNFNNNDGFHETRLVVRVILALFVGNILGQTVTCVLIRILHHSYYVISSPVKNSWRKTKPGEAVFGFFFFVNVNGPLNPFKKKKKKTFFATSF